MMRFKFLKRKSIANLPKTTGVYCFKSENREILYIGKAANIKTRVKNHFQQPSYRDNLFIRQTEKIGYIKTNSEIEALILEAKLIKKFQPKYNVLWKDDKNYFYVAATKEKFPRIFITHQPTLKTKNYKLKTNLIGPFVEGRSLKRTLDFLRKVFPYYTQTKHPKSYCLWCSLKLCPGPDSDKKEYKKNIKNLVAVLKGNRRSVLSNLKREMKYLSKTRDYEKAGKKRDQIMMLEKIIAHSRVLEPQIETPPNGKKKYFSGRMEAYDVSNIQGQEATGAMVVFKNGEPEKSQYRKFKIRMADKPSDTAMLKEILSRRFKHKEWPCPNLILIDGGKAQLNATIEIKNKKQKTKKIEIVALAKRNNELFRENEKKPVLLENLPSDFSNLMLRLRDEAHRFALAYHKKLRHKTLLKI